MKVLPVFTTLRNRDMVLLCLILHDFWLHCTYRSPRSLIKKKMAKEIMGWKKYDDLSLQNKKQALFETA